MLTSALASMCLAVDDLEGSQLCPGTPMSHSRDRMTTNPLSLYASFLGFQAQHAENGCNEALILALRETQNDQPMKEEEAIIPLPSPVELIQPFTVGQDNETYQVGPMGPRGGRKLPAVQPRSCPNQPARRGVATHAVYLYEKVRA
jgi:hypothetical protein